MNGISSMMTTDAAGAANSSPVKASKGSSLSMDDFFQLMVAQLKNQDMYNQADNTEFIAQMAQFSVVQALTDLNKQSGTAYSVSLVGKGATVIEKDANGVEQTISGLVQGVTLYKGETKIVIDGTPYSAGNIKEVFDGRLLEDTPKTIESDI